MKKILLVLGSWAMMLMGTATFTSCGDDDDDNGGSNGGGASIELVEKNQNLEGAKVDGNDVIYKPFISQGKVTVIIHYNGNTMESATTYQDCGTEELAKTACEEAKKEGSDAKVEGKYVVVSESAESSEDYKEFKNLSKQDLCEALNEVDELAKAMMGGLGDLQWEE